MGIDPAVKTARFAQLEAGDLFIYPHREGSCVGMKIVDPTQDGDMVMLLLGPNFPHGIAAPGLIRPPMATVISFGKEYVLRLPCSAQAWSAETPAFDIHCIAMTDQKAYVRVNYDAGQAAFQPCYIDMEAGRVHATSSGHFGRFSPLQGSPAFALEWELATSMPKPRTILAYPW
jgi:hypothetical protein